ncbi:MAG: hypothetical protein KC619_25420 [Myxococcales bacterium]|nr:hypothetical protein [Myxococcales bacterium]
MTTPFALAFGIVLGVVGAAWHLAVLGWRTAQLVSGHRARGWLAAPLGLAGPVGLFVVALVFGGEVAAWAFLAGAITTSAAVLLRVRRPK